MPPVIAWALGAIGAIALAKLLAAAGRKANAELDDIRGEQGEIKTERPIEKLERDPVTGEYRPEKS